MLAGAQGLNLNGKCLKEVSEASCAASSGKVEHESAQSCPTGGKVKGISTVPASTSSFTYTKGVGFSSGVLTTTAGRSVATTKQVFTRPVDISVMLRQTSGGAECGVVRLFPQTGARHSGYNAGIGWWAHHFGAGKDGSISKYGGNNGATSSWHTVRINAASDGYVYFYLDGSLRHKIKDNSYQKGTISLGHNCRNYEYKNLIVRQGVVCCQQAAVVPVTRSPASRGPDCPTNPPTRPPTAAPTPTPRPTYTPSLSGRGAVCWSTGDPHYLTFDRKKFDFYALGVFWLIKTPQIKIQTRLEQVNKWIYAASYNTGVGVELADGRKVTVFAGPGAVKLTVNGTQYTG